jgi:hypothetical protein
MGDLDLSALADSILLVKMSADAPAPPSPKPAPVKSASNPGDEALAALQALAREAERQSSDAAVVAPRQEQTVEPALRPLSMPVPERLRLSPNQSSWKKMMSRSPFG